MRQWQCRIGLEFKPQDLWVGAFWRRETFHLLRSRRLDIWICLLPMFPVHIIIGWKY